MASFQYQKWNIVEVSKIFFGYVAPRLSGKESACSAEVARNEGLIPGRRAWQPASVFLPRESHGQRSLAGYSPEGHKEPDTTQVT